MANRYQKTQINGEQVSLLYTDTGTTAPDGTSIVTPPGGSGGGGGGGPATIADGADVTQGAKADAKATDGSTSAWSVVALLKGLVDWALNRMPASLGQKTSANSLPVVVASDQTTLTTALQGDFISGSSYSVDVTLSASANTASQFAVPTGARGFQLINPSARIRFNAAGSLASSYNTTTTTPNATGVLGQYNSLVTGGTATRIFQPGAAPANLYINSATANATFTLEFF